jgi:hypothetical protein
MANVPMSRDRGRPLIDAPHEYRSIAGIAKPLRNPPAGAGLLGSAGIVG